MWFQQNHKGQQIGQDNLQSTPAAGPVPQEIYQDGEREEEIGFIVRRAKVNANESETPVVDLYPVNANFRRFSQVPLATGLTGAEVAKITQPFPEIAAGAGAEIKDYPLAISKVRFQGEPVAAVIADSRLAADPSYRDKVMEIALEAGADDVQSDEDGVTVITSPEAFGAVLDALTAAGLKAERAEVTMSASTQADITDVEQAEKIMKMIDMLEDLDDVQEVYSNANFTPDVMAALSK